MAKKGKSRSGFFVGLVLGMAIGAGVALLLAPVPAAEVESKTSEPGAEVRSRTQIGFDTLAGLLRDRYGDAIAQGRDAYVRAKDEVSVRYNRAKTGA